MDVHLYALSTCPYCRMVKDFLKENKVNFTEIDVGADRKAAMEMMDKSGEMGVPQVEVDGKIIVGFDKPALREALHI